VAGPISVDNKDLVPYVADVAINWGAASHDSRWHQIDGTLLFVDISGFTRLSERLADQGKIGAEELTGVLDRVFGEMLDVGSTRRGSLLKFGGDALLLMFDSDDHAMQACAAAVEMRSVLRSGSGEQTSVGRIDLRMSSGIHSGPIDLFLVGQSHRELLVVGPTTSRTTEMEGIADAGEIVVSEEVRRLIPSDFIGSPKGSGWLIRKRKINHPRIEPSVSAGSGIDVGELVPVGLLQHLSGGTRDAEHRQASIGFIEFKGTDALISDSGGEAVAVDLEALVVSIQVAARREDVTFLASDVAADGGKIILAAGVPTSQHDDEGRILRAVRAVLDSDQPLAVKAGVNRGHVFVGDIGTSTRRTFTVMGDTVNVAARLMAVGSSNSLVANPTVLDLSSTLFDVEALPLLSLKGKSQAIQAYSVGSESGVRPPVREHDLPFVGRDVETEMLVQILTNSAQTRTGAITTVTGGPGLGKTRLISEVLERCSGVDTLMIQAETSGATVPYWAFRDPMRRALEIARGSQQEMVVALTGAVSSNAPELSWAIPLLGDIMHIEVEDNEQTAALDPRYRPERAADAFVELLDAFYERPLVILVEDAHWIDEVSLGLLERLGTAVTSRPWSLILTARREDLESSPLGEEIALQVLNDEAVRSIVIEATAAAPLRPHELNALVSRAAGNPLFLSELVRLMRKTGDVDQLPASLDGVVSTDIDSLAPSSRRVLMYVAVLGMSFRRSVVEELLGPEQIDLDDVTLENLSRFIEPDGEDRLRFRHAVVHDVVYESLSYKRRKELHARAAEIIQRLAGDDTHSVAGSLAMHFSVSGDHRKALDYSVIAGDKAKAAYANTDAVRHYGRAIEAARQTPDTSAKVRSDLWKRLGETQDLMGQYEAARGSFVKAIKTAEGDPVNVADLYLRRAESWYGSGNLTQARRSLAQGRKVLGRHSDEPALRAMARNAAYEASVDSAGGDPVRILRSASRAIELGRTHGESEAIARGYVAMDWGNFLIGNVDPRLGERSVEIYQNLGMFDRCVSVLNNLGAYAYWEGDWNLALAWYERAVAAAERSGNVVEAANTKAATAEVFISQRRYAEAVPLIEDASRVLRASNAAQLVPFVLLQGARAELGLGHFQSAIEELDPLAVEQMSGDASDWSGEIVFTLAEALVRAKRFDRALDFLSQFEASNPEAFSSAKAGVLRVRGSALASIGEGEQASDAFEQALAASNESDDLYEELLIREARANVLGVDELGPTQSEHKRLQDLYEKLGVAR